MRSSLILSVAALSLAIGLTWPTAAAEPPTKAPVEKPAEKPATPPADDDLTTPAPGSPEWLLMDGLRLISDAKFDEWIARYCHTGKLCRSPRATKSVKRFNLQAAHRLVPYCLKGDKGDQLRITKRVESAEELKFWLACNVGGRPRPFTLQKDGGAWKFRRI